MKKTNDKNNICEKRKLAIPTVTFSFFVSRDDRIWTCNILEPENFTRHEIWTRKSNAHLDLNQARLPIPPTGQKLL